MKTKEGGRREGKGQEYVNIKTKTNNEKTAKAETSDYSVKKSQGRGFVRYW